jgi:hypothetical protein
MSPNGIGHVSAMVLLAYLPDIGSSTEGEVARLSRLAPINNDSGKKRGARHVEAVALLSDVQEICRSIARQRVTPVGIFDTWADVQMAHPQACPPDLAS